MSKLGVELHDDFAIFRVWAPFARSVAVRGDFSDWQEKPLAQSDKFAADGVWEIKIDGVEAGQSYKYAIVGFTGARKDKNDPRALALTDGDAGVSVVAADDFDWGDGEPNFQPVARANQVIYELHVGTFNRLDAATIGTFATAEQKLDYLRDLGVTTVELMPVTVMAMGGGGGGWGYSPVAIFAVEDSYGGAAGLKSFVRAAHARGLAVILDTVYNHFFSDTLWRFDGWSENNRGGIYFYNDARGDTPWGGRPDYGREPVRDFILDNVALWLTDYHIDGLRLDSTIYMRNLNGKNDDPGGDIADAWKLLQDITALARKIKPSALMIAEDCAGNAWITKSVEQQGCGFAAQWDLGLPHVIRDALGGADPQTQADDGRAPNLDNLVNVLQQNFNGDAFQRVIFADSHDTAANGGERIVQAVQKDPHDVAARQIAILSSAIALTAPGVPMLLAGSEFLQGGNFNDWNSLDWENVERFAGVVAAHRHLIALRKNLYGDCGGLASGEIKIILSDNSAKVLCYQRGGDAAPTIVLASFNSEKVANYALTFLPAGDWRVRFNSSWKGYSADFAELKLDGVNADTTIDLPPYVCLILAKNS